VRVPSMAQRYGRDQRATEERSTHGKEPLSLTYQNASVDRLYTDKGSSPVGWGGIFSGWEGIKRRIWMLGIANVRLSFRDGKGCGNLFLHAKRKEKANLLGPEGRKVGETTKKEGSGPKECDTPCPPETKDEMNQGKKGWKS